MNRHDEDDMQAAIIAWADDIARLGVCPEMAYLFAVPNGGARSAREGGRLKRQGVRPGVPDLILPWARRDYHGLVAELKTPTGTLRKEQHDWLSFLMAQGYLACLWRSVAVAQEELAWYGGFSL